MSLNVKKAMNVLLFLTAMNACICALKSFTNSRISLTHLSSTHSLSVSKIHEAYN
jgi:hypothetical protein